MANDRIMGTQQCYHKTIYFTVSSNMGITSKYIDRYPTASMTKNPPQDRYLACHPEVLSCKQQITVISKVHNLSNETTHGSKHCC